MRNNKPLYVQIEDYIRSQIESGRWRVDEQITTERELAEQFEVSRITAKNALNNLVNQGYLYRQRGKGTFVSAFNQSEGFVQKMKDKNKLSSHRNQLVGLIIPWMELHYSSLLFAGLETELGLSGHHVIVKRISSEEMEAEAIRDLLDMQVSGIIIVASRGRHFNDQLVRLALNKFPIVLVEKTMRDIRTNGVYCDTEQVGILLAEYLLNYQYRDFGLITYPTKFTYGVKERIYGFQSALVRKGVQPLPPSSILSVDPNVLDGKQQLNIGSGHEEIISFIKNHPNMKAVATVDALLAKLVGKACKELNRLDMTIVCCDEPAFVSAGTVTPVAYVDQYPYEMGKTAAQMLGKAISEGADHNPEHKKFKPRLVEF